VEELEARARQDAPTWAYQLDWYDHDGEAARLRAFHTLDIPLVFRNTRQPGSHTGNGTGAQGMADAMSNALLALARHGNPGHAGLPAWEPYALPQRRTLLFDTTSRLVDDPRRGERQLYAQVPFIQRGTF
jgi:para-nitrobenzyl esterase